MRSLTFNLTRSKHGEISSAKKDAFLNPEGREYDLGREGAFGKFSVLVALLCPQHLDNDKFMYENICSHQRAN